MKVLSNPTVYAIRALIFMVTQQSSGRVVSIRTLTEKLDISFHLLTKTFQVLTKAGILTSFRGPNGGIAFSRNPNEVFLIDVVLAIEGEHFFDNCFLGLPGCGEKQPCPVHEYWSETKEDLKKRLSTTTFQQLSDMEARIGIID